jgi:hypothetical protein
MSQSSTWLLEHKKNVYSQSGEDGIIEKILDTLPVRDKWCVEFGAWDGKYLCNVRNLIENKDYGAVLIEANKTKFVELQENYREASNVFLINEFVGFEPDDNLDKLLKTTPIPLDFDFLSIDIDGNDYHVWKVVSQYQPKVICIEFNHTIPPEIDFVQEAHPNVSQGSSLTAIVRLGKEKGYELISVVGCNAIMVENAYFEMFGIDDNSVQSLWVERNAITYLFVGYDGQVFLRGKKSLPWHAVPLKESDVNVLPSFLRKYQGNYNYIETGLFAFYLLFHNPEYLLQRWRHFREKRAAKLLGKKPL